MEQKKDPRKDFRKRSTQFFFIGLVVATSSTLVAFEWRTSETSIKPLPPISIVDIIDIEPPVRFVSKTEVPKLTPPKIKLPPVLISEPDPISAPDPGPEPKPVVMPPDDPGFAKEPFVPEVVLPVRWAEHMPEFDGGEPAFYDYLRKNLKYPKLAVDFNVEAKLYVQFVVNVDGTISDVEVLHAEGFGLDEEAARVIREMPNWKPGMQGGKKVSVIYVIPINFSLL